MKNKVSDVRDHLVAMLEQLGDDTMAPEKMAQVLERAKVSSQVAGTYINAVRVELDAIRIMDETGRLSTAVGDVPTLPRPGKNTEGKGGRVLPMHG